MSPDFTDAGTRTPNFLANAPELRHTELYRHRAGIGSALLADNKVDEKAHTGWFPESDWH